MSEPTFAIEPSIGFEEFIRVLEESGLAARRPVGDADRMAKMLLHAGVIATARIERRLVGVARSITDHVYCAYLSDLAVAKAHQGRGIGRQLIALTRTHLGTAVSLNLKAAPGAETYYDHIGMPRAEHAFVHRREL